MLDARRDGEVGRALAQALKGGVGTLLGLGLAAPLLAALDRTAEHRAAASSEEGQALERDARELVEWYGPTLLLGVLCRCYRRCCCRC